MDVSDLDSVRKAINQIKEPLDGLVLNAGPGPSKVEITPAGVTSVVALNVLGHALLVDLLLKQEKLAGSVVFSYYRRECRLRQGL